MLEKSNWYQCAVKFVLFVQNAIQKKKMIKMSDKAIILLAIIFEIIYVFVLKYRIEKRVKFENSLLELKKYFDERKL